MTDAPRAGARRIFMVGKVISKHGGNMRRLFLLLLLSFMPLISSCDWLSDEEDAQLLYISVTTRPAKTTYYLGEEFDPTGIVVKAYYTGKSSKNFTGSVSFSGFDSSTTGDKKITVTYSEGGKTYSDSFYVSVKQYPRATYPYDKSRIVTVTFQYYRRKSTADTFEPYTYSTEPYDDINGSVEFRINGYGMNYKVGDVADCYRYYPSNKSSSVALCDIDEAKVRPTKYINGNSITLEPILGSGENFMPYSFLFTDKADEIFPTVYMQSSEISVTGARMLLFEDSMFKEYKLDYIGRTEHITFKGIEYPQFETDGNNVLVKGKILSQINDYFIRIITVETSVQDVDIRFPAVLWGIDHFE